MTAATRSISQARRRARNAVASQLRPRYDHRWLTMAVLSLSMLVVVVDTTIVNIAVPTLAGALPAGAAALEWIVDAYSLAFAALLLPAGSLADRFGQHRALAAGMALFGASSLAAALSSTATELIAWRAIMGVGAALVVPATMAIMTGVFTDTAERAKAIAVWSGTSGLGVAVGPTAGGWLLARFSWGSIFMVNLPIAAFSLVAGYFLVPASGTVRQARFDPLGTLLAAAAFGVLTYTLINAGAAGWTSAATAAGSALSVLLFAAFAGWESRCPHPMMELSLFRVPQFTVASGAVAILFFGLSGASFVLTQIYQFILGYSPLGAGIRWLPSALALAVAVPAATRLAARVGARAVVTAGLATTAAGLGFLAFATGRSAYSHYLIAATIMAVGTGLAAPPATQSVIASLAPPNVGVGSAMNNAVRSVGAVLGVAVIGSVAATSYSHAMAGYARGRAAAQGVRAPALTLARHSIAAASQLTPHRGGTAAASAVRALQEAAAQAFVRGASPGLLTAAAGSLAAAVACARLLPAPRPNGRGATSGMSPARRAASRAASRARLSCGDGTATSAVILNRARPLRRGP